MTTVVVAQSSPSSSIHCRGITPINSITDVDGSHQNLHQQLGVEITHYSPLSSSYQQQHSVASDPYHSDTTTEEEDNEGEERVRKRRRERAVGGEVGEQEDEEENWSVLALFVTAFRKSLVRCYNNKGETESGSISVSGSSSWGKMEIGIPTEVRHVAHVTFDRFDGFLGLPVEFEPEVPRRAPSASATVFGVSTNSMQLSFDSRGNSVPTILLMMQRRLYSIGGLEVEGIFRINAGNAQEEYVRDQLNRGVVPHDADVHCLAGLIKAWFRELPTGLLDTLSPEELMRCQTEEECAQLARLLPSTEASLLDWAVNLMADIAQHESSNKMNARNVAVVFAPNMTHVMDPLTALVHAVQVMNFLKTLITRTLREREDPVLDAPPSSKDHFDETDPQSPLQTIFEGTREGDDEDNHKLGSEKPPLSHHNRDEELFAKAGEGPAFLASIENIHPNSNQSSSTNEDDECNHPDGPAGRGAEIPGHRASSSVGEKNKACENSRKKVRSGLLIKCALEKGQRKGNVKMNQPAEKAKGNDIVSQIHTESDRPEAWR